MRLSLAGESSYAGFGLEAREGETGLSGCLGLGAFEGAGTGILLGPGSVSGITRLLVDPTSPTALSQGAPVELDRALESRTSVLGIHAGPVSLFALAEGSGITRELGASSAGVSCGVSGPGGGVAAIAAVSYGKAAAPASGWRPDPSACPAATIVDQPAFSAAIVADRQGATGGSLVALAATYGRLAGPGIAFRMESRESVGPFRLRVAAGTASPAFRGLLGPRQRRLLETYAEARLALRHAASLAAFAEAQASGESLLYAPLWGRSGGLGLVLPVGAVGGRLETKVQAGSPAGSVPGGSWTLALVRQEAWAAASSLASLGGSLSWSQGVSGLDLSLKTEIAGRGGLPSLGLDLSLELFAAGKPESPVAATGGLRIAFPLGAAACLELDAALPDKGVPLGPSRASGPAFSPVLGLRYRASAGEATP